jgi:hypothetical protein
VARLLDRTLEQGSPERQGIALLCGWRARSLGRPVPVEIQALERIAHATALSAPAVLTRIGGALEGSVVLIKGPELARLYPDDCRLFGDLDLLVEDAAAGQRALLAAGFVETDPPELYVDIHHLRPLVWPSLPLKIELHSRPKWPQGIHPPPFAEILADAIPSPALPDGFLVPSRLQHALIVAAHSWAHAPLRVLRDLIDLAAVAEGVERGEALEAARAWGLERVWRSSIRAADALFGDGRPTFPLRTWGRHLRDGRERTVLESHLQRLLSPYWALPPAAATGVLAWTLVAELRPSPGEPLGTKLQRMSAALRHAFAPLSEHRARLPEQTATGRSESE